MSGMKPAADFLLCQEDVQMLKAQLDAWKAAGKQEWNDIANRVYADIKAQQPHMSKEEQTKVNQVSQNLETMYFQIHDA